MPRTVGQGLAATLLTLLDGIEGPSRTTGFSYLFVGRFGVSAPTSWSPNYFASHFVVASPPASPILAGVLLAGGVFAGGRIGGSSWK